MGSVVSRSDEAASEGDIGVVGMELVASREDVVRGPCVQDQILPLLRCRQHLNAARKDCHSKMPLSNPSFEIERSFSQALHPCKICLSDLACSILPHHGAGFMLMSGSLAVGTRQGIMLLLSSLLPIPPVLLTSATPSTELLLPP